MNTTFNIAFDKDLLNDVDAAVKQDMSTRSEYLRRLARKDIQSRKKRAVKDAWEALEAVADEIGAAAQKAGYATTEDYARLAQEIRDAR